MNGNLRAEGGYSFIDLGNDRNTIFMADHDETYKNRQQFIDKMSESHLNNAVKTIMGLIHGCIRS